MKISVVTPTVCSDFPLWEFPDRHILSYVADVLAEQDFDYDEFELIVVDGLWHTRRTYFEDHAYPFTIKHVPPMRLGKDWVLDHRYTNHNRMRNTGLVHAEGELIFQIDDTLSFGPSMLSRVWREWDEFGLCLSPLVEWKCGDQHVGMQIDWRLAVLENAGLERMIGSDPEAPREVTAWGIFAYPLEIALDVGGYDELFDAGVLYSDTFFGIRLAAAGAKVLVDRDAWCTHEAHDKPDLRIVDTFNRDQHVQSIKARSLKCNRLLMIALNERQKITGDFITANSPGAFARELLGFFQMCPYYMDGAEERTCAGKNPCECPHLARQGPNPNLLSWAAKVPTYDLRELRSQVPKA